MELFPLTTFEKDSILDVLQGFDCAFWFTFDIFLFHIFITDIYIFKEHAFSRTRIYGFFLSPFQAYFFFVYPLETFQEL